MPHPVYLWFAANSSCVESPCIESTGIGGGLAHGRIVPFLIGTAFLGAAWAIVPSCGPVGAAEVPSAAVAAPSEMAAYTQEIEPTPVKIDMLPIPGGTFVMGSPNNEANHGEDEGPQQRVKVDPFWMAKYEITWDVYEVWMFDLDVHIREKKGLEATSRDLAADDFQLSQPTAPYTDMTFGMGKKGYPAICMTQFAARIFCQWLSAKTGHYYRLPTEAEWEYACRAGTTTAYSFGDDPSQLDEYAWSLDNSESAYHLVGKKKPSPWGLHDMHGNVAEWVLDQYKPDFYQTNANSIRENPVLIPTELYPHVVRGGSWDEEGPKLRSAARGASTPDWKQQDPNIPQSIWYFTDALHVGFRIVRPLHEPSAEEKENKWDKSEPFQNRKQGRQ